MKKIFFSISALFVAAALLFTGCAQRVHFSFSAYWTAAGSHPENFSETSVYSVEHVTDYSRETAENSVDDFSAKDNGAFTAAYENGQYTVKIESVTSIPADLGIDIGDYTELYRIETEFNITVTYHVISTDKSYTFDDRIESVAYCKAAGASHAPVYSRKSYDSTSAGGTEDSVKINRFVYETEINWFYQSGVALLSKIAAEKPASEYDGDEAYSFYTVENEQIEIKYEEGTVLDNETLFFAIRGLRPSSDSFTASLKIIDTAYNSEQPVSAASSRAYSFDDDWTLVSKNGTADETKQTITESMPVCLVTVQRGNTTYSGSPKHCYYQLESDKSVPYRALFVRMVDKLPNDLGALDYKLQSITTSE